jgi:5-aminolevulinate synthase
MTQAREKPQASGFNYQQALNQTLSNLHQEGRYRIFTELERPAAQFPTALWHSSHGIKEVIIWCSNDYLNMAHHPKVMSAMHEAIATGATGAGGTRNIGGNHHYHVQLESLLAQLHNKEAALSFTSGWVANLTALSVLGKVFPNAIILSDAENHNSMIEGIKRSGLQKIVFKHNDPINLEQHLQQLPLEQPKIIAFESLYSMDGNTAPIAAFCELAKKYNALTYLDEVHAVGLYGTKAGGQAQAQGVEQDIDIIQGTLGKAIGLHGGYIAGTHPLIDTIRSLGAGFIFSTAMPPVIAAGAIASIKHLMQSNTERQQQQTQTNTLKQRLLSTNLPVMASSSHIVPIMVGNATKCKQLSDLLLEQHSIYVQPINYPTVPKGTERLRFTPSPKHTDQMINDLIHALEAVWHRI